MRYVSTWEERGCERLRCIGTRFPLASSRWTRMSPAWRWWWWLWFQSLVLNQKERKSTKKRERTKLRRHFENTLITMAISIVWKEKLSSPVVSVYVVIGILCRLFSPPPQVKPIKEGSSRYLDNTGWMLLIQVLHYVDHTKKQLCPPRKMSQNLIREWKRKNSDKFDGLAILKTGIRKCLDSESGVKENMMKLEV